jgi:hypothetical protein
MDVAEQRQQVADPSLRFDRVPQRAIGPDAVAILPTHFFTVNDSGGFQIGDDPLDRTFGNAHLGSDFSQHQ